MAPRNVSLCAAGQGSAAVWCQELNFLPAPRRLLQGSPILFTPKASFQVLKKWPVGGMIFFSYIFTDWKIEKNKKQCCEERSTVGAMNPHPQAKPPCVTSKSLSGSNLHLQIPLCKLWAPIGWSPSVTSKLPYGWRSLHSVTIQATHGWSPSHCEVIQVQANRAQLPCNIALSSTLKSQSHKKLCWKEYMQEEDWEHLRWSVLSPGTCHCSCNKPFQEEVLAGLIYQTISWEWCLVPVWSPYVTFTIHLQSLGETYPSANS